jgi:hypothetical protein
MESTEKDTTRFSSRVWRGGGRTSPSRTASRSRSARPLMIDKGGKGAPPRPRSRHVHARLWGEGVGRGLCAEDDGAEGAKQFPLTSVFDWAGGAEADAAGLGRDGRHELADGVEDAPDLKSQIVTSSF